MVLNRGSTTESCPDLLTTVASGQEIAVNRNSRLQRCGGDRDRRRG